jgi:hypothetical protein
MKPSLSVLLVLAAVLFNVMVPIVSAKSILMSGEQLRKGEYIESPDGSKRFVVKDGKAIIEEKGIRDLQTWLLTPENDQGSDGKQYQFAVDNHGILSGLDASGQITRYIRPAMGTQMEGIWELSLWNNGILYLKNPAGVLVWNNICDNIKTYVDSNEILMSACLISPDYGSFLYMKENGNLVLYKGYTPLFSWSNLYQGGNELQHRIFLYLSTTGTLKIIKKNTKEEGVFFGNDGSGVKEGRYRLTLTNDAKMLIVDSSDNVVALLPPKPLR